MLMLFRLAIPLPSVVVGQDLLPLHSLMKMIQLPQ